MGDVPEDTKLCCLLRKEFGWVWEYAQGGASPTSTIKEMWDGPAREHAPAITALRDAGVKLTSVFDLLNDISCKDHPKTMAKQLSGLRYLGGKSANSPVQVGKWVSDHLGPTGSRTWVEPFFGQGGVFFHDRLHLMNGSMIVTKQSQTSGESFRMMGYAPDLFAGLRIVPVPVKLYTTTHTTMLDQEPHTYWTWLSAVDDIVVRAWATTYILTKSVVPSLAENSWAVAPTTHTPELPTPEHLDRLGERLKNVTVDNRDALVILERCKSVEGVLIYCDPPYPNTKGYREGLDQGKFDALCLEQIGHVGISGFAGDRPTLEEAGWNVHHMDRTVTFDAGGKSSKRREALWMNYEISNTLF